MNEVNEKENIVSKYGVNRSKGVERKNWSDEVQFAQPQATASENRLESYSEYPGWLWDSTKEEWVPDPDYSDEGES